MLLNVKQATVGPTATIIPGTLVHTDEYAIDSKPKALVMGISLFAMALESMLGVQTAIVSTRKTMEGF